MHESVQQRVQEVETTQDRLNRDQFAFSAGSNGQETVVAEFDADQDLAIDADRRFALAPVAFETFATDGNAGNKETFALGNDLIESEYVSSSIEVFKDDGASVTAVEPDAVDFANDSFDFTDGGTGNDLYVFFAPGDQARVLVRKDDPRGTQDDLIELDVGLIHRRDRFDSPLEFDFARALESVFPDNFRLQVVVDAPYVTRYRYEGGSEPVTAPNGILSVPIRRAQEPINELATAVRHQIAEG